LPSDDPRIHAALRKKPSSLSYGELTVVINQYPNQSSAKLYPYRLRRAQLAGSAPGCLLAILCGLAIGLRKKSSSVGSMVGIALLGTFLFYLLKTFCDALGEKGIVSEWEAVGIPYLLVLVVCFLLILRNR
jgi:lipopolysaccharide export LptBFGC system permease protein LptF